MNVRKFSKRAGRLVDVNLLGVAAAALLLSYSFSFAPPAVIVKNTSAMLGSASVGVGASVESNQFNTLAAQLADKENQLNDRESILDQREYLLEIREAPVAVYSFILGLVLCLLVAANFYYDWRRERRRAPARAPAVDLRRSA
jgi:hypothetical protein